MELVLKLATTWISKRYIYIYICTVCLIFFYMSAVFYSLLFSSLSLFFSFLQSVLIYNRNSHSRGCLNVFNIVFLILATKDLLGYFGTKNSIKNIIFLSLKYNSVIQVWRFRKILRIFKFHEILKNLEYFLFYITKVFFA